LEDVPELVPVLGHVPVLEYDPVLGHIPVMERAPVLDRVPVLEQVLVLPPGPLCHIGPIGLKDPKYSHNSTEEITKTTNHSNIFTNSLNIFIQN